MRKFIKSCIPPILLKLINLLRRPIRKYIYGVSPEYSAEVVFNYSDFNQTYDNTWDSQNWAQWEQIKLKKTVSRLFQLRKAYEHEKEFGLGSQPNIHQKSVITSCRILNKLDGFKKIHVIDFGGGSGTLVPHLLNSPSNKKLELEVSVIDSPAIIKFGVDAFSDSPNIRFFKQENADIKGISDRFKSENVATLLNISSVLQYVPNYKEFLATLLEQTKPLFVTITRVPRCENANNDAFAIQNVTTLLGFCGSTVVNLFGKDSLTDYMQNLGYIMLFEDFNEINDTAYFDKCDDEQYRNMTLVAYIFVKNKS